MKVKFQLTHCFNIDNEDIKQSLYELIDNKILDIPYIPKKGYLIEIDDWLEMFELTEDQRDELGLYSDGENDYFKVEDIFMMPDYLRIQFDRL